MTTRRHACLLSAALVALLLAGCSGNPPTLGQLTASLGVDTLPIGPSSDPPVEVYSRVAKGALKCWFGPEGSLKATHVFHAKVDPPAAGGAAEIGVHTREAGSTIGVLRAFGITINPVTGGGSAIEVQNVRFPEKEAALMKSDVARWIAGQDNCSIVGTGGWQAGPKPIAEPAKESIAAKGKERPAAKR